MDTDPTCILDEYALAYMYTYYVICLFCFELTDPVLRVL